MPPTELPPVKEETKSEKKEEKCETKQEGKSECVECKKAKKKKRKRTTPYVPNKWNVHVSSVRKANPSLSLKEAMIAAKATYVK